MKACLQCEHIFTSDEWICPICGHKPIKLGEVIAHAIELANSGCGFKPEYFSELARLEAAHFWFLARNKLIVWVLRKYAPNICNFLEIGCGTGFVLSGIAKALPEVELFGSEIFVAGLSHAAKRIPTGNLMQMDARQIPFINEFDAMGCFDVLEHIEEDEAVLAQLYRALKPGGILLLTVPQHPWLWSRSDEYAYHVRRYTCLEIEGKVHAQGFEILRSTSFVSTLLPAMMLSRWFQKRNESNFNPNAELNINPILNKVFYSFLRLENAGIQAGLNYPIGGSRLIVAKKIAYKK